MSKCGIVLCVVLMLLPGSGALAATSHRDAGLTIGLSRAVVIYGQSVEVSGTATDEPAGEEVRLFAKIHGGEFRPIARFSGVSSWRYLVKPGIRTSLQARSSDESSRVVTVNVRPRVTLVRRKKRFLARVVAARSFEDKVIALQRRARHGRWITIKKAVLRRNPLTFEALLPKGSSRLRAYLPARQAGPGYLPGFSRPIRVRR